MTPTLAKAAFVLMAAAWYVLRIPHQRKARKMPIAHNALDLRERVRLAISLTGLGLIPLGYVAIGGTTFAARPFSPSVAWAGVVLAIAALVMFRLTHKALGRYWSVSLQMREGHKLITEGVYARIRHPMYSAFWLWALAQALLLPNWIAGLSGIVGFGTLYLLRVGPEEDMLLQQFGEDYRAYMAQTGRLWPKFF